MHKRSARYLIYQLVILVIVAFCLAACAMRTAGAGRWLVIPDQASNQLELTTIDQATVVDVFSERGIGRANVQWLGGDYPARLFLRFHLRGLEELRFTYATTTITLSISSTDAGNVQQEVTTSAPGEAQPVTPTSPYWMKTLVTADWIEVELPPAFLQARHTGFTVQWIDFFR